MLLVKEGLSSKQIARELGISPRTVDQHVAAALEALGVANRMAAISRLYETERAEYVPQTDGPFMLGTAANVDETHVIDSREDLRPPAILPPLGGAENAASRTERITWMIRIAVFCAMMACLSILTIMGLYEIAKGLNR